MPAAEERTEERKCDVVAPTPTGMGQSYTGYPQPNRERPWKVIQRLGVSDCTHILSSTYIPAATTAVMGDFKREILSLKTVRGTGRLWSALTEKDFWPFGEVDYVESQAVAQLQCGCHILTLF